MRGIRSLAFGTIVLACPSVGAPQDSALEPPPIPADAARESAQPPVGQPEEAPQSAPAAREEVIERVEGNQTITEYRRHGQVYMYKVKPKNGPAQYWVDRHGDGQFQPQETEVTDDVNLPKWRIGNW